MLLFAFQIAVLIYSVVLHELAHGFAARSLGDRTAERMGRLTLNPLAHLDLFGSFVLPIMSSLLGGFMIGYAKPVPYSPENLSDRHFGPSKVAIAGPATNIALALIFGLAIRFFAPMLPELTVTLFSFVVWINLVLAMFNLLPIPPLDGHWLLMAFLPSQAYAFKVALYRYQWVLLVLAIFFVFPVMAPVLESAFTLLTGITPF